MKYILAILVALSMSLGGAAALSVGHVNNPHLTGVTVAHPTQTLKVQQAQLYSSASTDSTQILQGN